MISVEKSMENLKLSQMFFFLFKYTKFYYNAKFKDRTKRMMQITGPHAYIVYKRELIL